MNEQIPYFRERLKAKLPPLRYEHSLGVSYTAMALAMRYEYDLDKAEIAGLLHDCAKHYTDDEIIKKCRKHEIPLEEAELSAPAVLHAKYGAWLAERRGRGSGDPRCDSVPYLRPAGDDLAGQDHLYCGLHRTQERQSPRSSQNEKTGV